MRVSFPDWKLPRLSEPERWRSPRQLEYEYYIPRTVMEILLFKESTEYWRILWSIWKAEIDAFTGLRKVQSICVLILVWTTPYMVCFSKLVAMELRLSTTYSILLGYIEHQPCCYPIIELHCTALFVLLESCIRVSHTGIATADIISRFSHTVRSDLEEANCAGIVPDILCSCGRCCM